MSPARADRLKALRARVAKARTADEKADAEAELANAESDARDDARLASVTRDLLPLVAQLEQNAVEPTSSWVACVRVAVAQLEDAQRARKEGTPIDPDRLADQAERLIAAVTRLRPI